MNLKIMTFNVGLMRYRILWSTLFEFTPFIERRLVKAAKYLKNLDADVICLQEVFYRKHQKYLIKKLAKKFPYFTTGAPMSHINVGSGLLTLSKYPIKTNEFYHFKTVGLDEKIFGRMGSLRSDIVIDMDSQFPIETTVFNTHMTAGGISTNPESKSAEQIRHGQILELDRLVNQFEAMDKNIILSGDFNFGLQASKNNYDQMVSRGYFDVGHELSIEVTWDNKNHHNLNCIHSASPSQKIDHVFLGPKSKKRWSVHEAFVALKENCVQIKKGLKVPISDHYAFMCTLSLNK
jgi:endonuclease/exonuclease/phosphatase family metal-dependent hydrolase